MKAEFVRVAWGISFTNALLSFDHIKEHIQSLQNGGFQAGTLKSSYDLAITGQQRMEEEILQTLRTTDAITQAELFEYIIPWRDYFQNWLDYYIYDTALKIETYNQKSQADFEKFVIEEEEKFKSTILYKTLQHKDYYEVKYANG